LSSPARRMSGSCSSSSGSRPTSAGSASRRVFAEPRRFQGWGWGPPGRQPGAAAASRRSGRSLRGAGSPIAWAAAGRPTAPAQAAIAPAASPVRRVMPAGSAAPGVGPAGSPPTGALPAGSPPTGSPPVGSLPAGSGCGWSMEAPSRHVRRDPGRPRRHPRVRHRRSDGRRPGPPPRRSSARRSPTYRRARRVATVTPPRWRAAGPRGRAAGRAGSGGPAAPSGLLERPRCAVGSTTAGSDAQPRCSASTGTQAGLKPSTCP
jgi:hypothetical protein